MMKVETMLALHYEYQAETFDRDIAIKILPTGTVTYDQDGYVELRISILVRASNENATKLRKAIRELVSLLQLDVEVYERERDYLQRLKFRAIEEQYKEVEHLVTPLITLYQQMCDWRDMANDRSTFKRSYAPKEIYIRPTRKD